MVVPYAFIKARNQQDPFLNVEGSTSEDKIDSLMQPGNMHGKYLGACLDACRYGSTTAVLWQTDIKGLMGLIQRWREENDDNPALYHEVPLEEMYSQFELPHIENSYCPREENHKGTFVDPAGRLRCKHRNLKWLKPSFIEGYPDFDEFSQMHVKSLYEREPRDPRGDEAYDTDRQDSKEYQKYLVQCANFKSEQPIDVLDVCYAIISDKNVVLPFETILRRFNLAALTKNVYCNDNPFYPCKRVDLLKDYQKNFYEDRCPGHDMPSNEVIFKFDGWQLAHYFQKWKEQSSNPPWFAKNREDWPSHRARFALDCTPSAL
jgi:hypothetical protein